MSGADAAAVLGIDGGGSKTDLVALSLEGAVLFRTRGSGSNPQTAGLDRSLSVIRRLAADALEFIGPRRLLQTNVYLSGMDLPVEIEIFSSAIAAEKWSVAAQGGAAVVDNDLFALLRAGTSRPDAVAVVCGTGINAVGVRADGRTARFPALGRISGDWGGGADLGALALWHAARSEDGRGAKTVLEKMVPEAYNLPTVMDLVEGLHLNHIESRSVADLTRVLFRAAMNGDEVAQSLVDRQADEVATLAATALRRLELLDADVPVVLGGGVLASGDTRLISGIRTGLAAQAPSAHLHLVTAPPIVGAGLLALEAAGAGTDALTRARREMERSP